MFTFPSHHTQKRRESHDIFARCLLNVIMENAPAVLEEKPDVSVDESRPNKNGKRIFQDEQCVLTPKRPAKCAQSDEKLPAEVAIKNKNVEEMKSILHKLQIQAAEMDEVMRKLKLVKTYRLKKKLDQLEVLTEKWRQACQEAVQALAKSCCDQTSTTCKSILDQLQIEYSLIKYNPEDDCFY